MKFDEFKQKAIAVLACCSPMRASEIAQATGANISSVYGWLKKLVIAGDIVKGEDGVYRLATNEELSEAFIETAIAESEARPVECEVIEMRMPRSAMAVEKVAAKDGHIVLKTGSMVSGDTSNALSLSPKELKKEAKLERKWVKLLTQDNKSEGFESIKSISKIASNWKEIVKLRPDIHNSGFIDIPDLIEALLDQCARQKWYKDFSEPEKVSFRRDCERYIAGEIWDYKRIVGHCLDEQYHRLAAAQNIRRKARGASIEGANSGMKPISKSAKNLNDSTDLLLKHTETIAKKVEKIDLTTLDQIRDDLTQILSEAKSVCVEAKQVATELKDLKSEIVLAIGEKWDETYGKLNPPSGFKGLRSGNLYQFPEAK